MAETPGPLNPRIQAVPHSGGSQGNSLSGKGSRITGGAWKGRPLAPSPAGVRPTAAAMRAALFNWLGNDCAGMRCLDLFAGSGALSLEALSRGAEHATLVESSSPVLRILRGQMAEFALPATYALVRSRAERWLKNCTGAWDLILMDPPYDSQLIEACLNLISQRQLLRPGGLLYLESRADLPADLLPEGLSQMRKRQSASHCQLLYRLD